MEQLTPTMNQRRRLNIPLNFQPKRNVLHPETEKKLTEIMKRNGLIKVNGIDYKTEVADLEEQGELGNGTSGHVMKMKHKATGTIIAVKQMRRTGNDEENKRIIMDLDVVLKSHNCPYIVQCLGCFITEADVWIVMELMSTCFDKLQKRTKLPIPENILRHITECTVRALSYLKDTHGVIHRDVKPSNILIDEKGDIKLCDFGISGRLVDSKAKTRSAGCAAYMAPERIDPKKPEYDIRADVWSLGITLVELATGHYPYRGCKTDFEVLTKVLEADPPRLPVDEGFSEEFQDFVAQCLTKNYHKRPKYPELLRHPFLNYDPSLRVDVAEWFQRICDNAGIQLPRQELPSHAIPPLNRLSSLPHSPEPQHVNPFSPAIIPNIANTLHTTNLNNYNPFVSSSVNNFSLPTENVVTSSTITTITTQGLYHQYNKMSDAESLAQRNREQKETARNDIQNMIKNPRLVEDHLANEMHMMYPQKSPYLPRKNSFEPNIAPLNNLNLGSTNSPYLQRKHDYLFHGGAESPNGGSKYQQLQPQQQPNIAALSPVVKKRYVSGQPISEDLQYRHLHGNTSPIVLQRFYHQQNQLREKEEEESPPILAPRYRDEYPQNNNPFRNTGTQSPLLSNLRYVQHQQYPRQQQSPSPMRQLRNPPHEPIYHPQLPNHFASQNYVRNEIHHHQPQHPQHHQHPPHIQESHIPVYQYKPPGSPYQKIGPEAPSSPYLDRIRQNMEKPNFYDRQQAPFEANGRENGGETNGNTEQIKDDNGWLNSFAGVVKRRIAATYMQLKLKNEPKDKKDKTKSLAQVSPLHKTVSNPFAQSPPQSMHVLSGIDQRHRSPDPPPRANRGHQSPLVLRKKLELAQSQSPLVQRRYMSASPPPMLPPRTTVNSVPNSPHLRQSRINYTPEPQRRIYRQLDQ